MNMDKLKQIFKKDTLPYVIEFIIVLAVIIVYRSLVGFNSILWIADIGSLTGALYSIFMAKHKGILGFSLNIVSTAIVGTTALLQHAWLLMASCYGIILPMLIFGLIRWIINVKKGKSSNNINKLSKKGQIIVFSAFLVLLPALMFLVKYLNGNLWYLDAICSLSSVVGVIFCSFTYLDQYYYFTLCNVAGVTLYIILCFSDLNNLPTVLLYTSFLVNGILGYFNWQKIIKQNSKEKSQVENE